MAQLEVLKADELKHEMINIKKPIKNKELINFDIFYDNRILLLQTGIMKIISKGYYSQFVIHDHNFRKILTNMISYIFKSIKNKRQYNEYFMNKKKCKVFDHNTLSICNLEQEINVFDIEYNLQGGSDVLSIHDNVRLILYVKNAWVNNTSYGLNIKVVQAQFIEPYHIQCCLFKKATKIPMPPPPPPPPTYTNDTLTTDIEKKSPVIRPTLEEIVLSKTKLKKIN